MSTPPSSSRPGTLIPGAYTFTFLPRGYTAAAYANKAFTDQPNLKAIVETLKKRHRFLNRGQLIFRDPVFPDCPDLPRTQEFSGTAELEEILTKLEWNPATISKVVIYNDGHWLVQPLRSYK